MMFTSLQVSTLGEYLHVVLIAGLEYLEFLLPVTIHCEMYAKVLIWSVRLKLDEHRWVTA